MCDYIIYYTYLHTGNKVCYIRETLYHLKDFMYVHVYILETYSTDYNSQLITATGNSNILFIDQYYFNSNIQSISQRSR